MDTLSEGLLSDLDSKASLNHRDGDAEVVVESDEEEDNGPIIGPDEPLHFQFKWKTLWKFAGPGWLMSLAYLDPGNLESDLQQGAYTGYRIIWVLWWATVCGLLLQEMSARLGVVTGMDLAQVCRQRYPRYVCYILYVMMELAVIGSDIQEVVGSAIALKLLFGWKLWIGCLVTGLDTFTFLAVHYLGVRYLEALITSLISTMAVCFCVNWGESGFEPAETLEGWIVPYMNSWCIMQAVSAVGAVIMPHNLYLHSGLVQSRKINRRNPQLVHNANWYNFIESAVALLFSFFVNLAVVSTFWLQFYQEGCARQEGGPFACVTRLPEGCDQGNGCQGASVDDCHAEEGMCVQVGLESAGPALHHSLGKAAQYIWGVGLLAAGQASTMTATYAGQIIMGGFLQIEVAPWLRVAFTRMFALGPALAVALATAGHPQVANIINEWLNILQSIQLPFAMLPLLHMTSMPQIMGRFKSSATTQAAVWILALAVMSINVYLVITFLSDPSSPVPNTTGFVVFVGIYAFVYLCFCMLLIQEELRAMARWALGYGRMRDELAV